MGGGTGETGFTEKSSYLTTYAVTGIHEALRSRSFPRTHLYHLLLFLFFYGCSLSLSLCHPNHLSASASGTLQKTSATCLLQP